MQGVNVMTKAKLCGILPVLAVLFAIVQVEAGSPDWAVNPSAYEFNGSVVSAVYKDTDDVGSDGDLLGAFVGEECRGVVGALQTPGGNYVFPITVFSNQASGESLSFMYYGSASDLVCGIGERLEFVADMTIGSSFDPMHMNIDSCSPFAPSNPIPCIGCWQDTVETLSWDGGDPDSDDSVVYYIYLGTETEPPLFDSTAAHPASATGIVYAAPPLVDGLIYQWRIVARDMKGMTASGPIWNFSVGPGAIEPTPWGRIKMLFE
jgi:hypothetical protein